METAYLLLLEETMIHKNTVIVTHYLLARKCRDPPIPQISLLTRGEIYGLTLPGW